MIQIEYVEPYAKLQITFAAGVEALRVIEQAGRISHRSEEAMTADSYKRFIPAVVLGHGDWSIVEHVSASVEFLVDRGISHEIVRHRIASYTQESTRFVNYGKKGVMQFVIPDNLEPRGTTAFNSSMSFAVAAYEEMLAIKLSPQVARSVLPHALATKLLVTANLRSWRGFLIKRTTAETHLEMRRVTDPLLIQFQKEYPYLFDDITPGMRQAEALKRGM